MRAVQVMERVLGPLDRARVGLLRALGSWSRPLMRDRELRVGVMGLVAVGTAWVGVWAWPLWMLALGPIVLGVPHVVSDVRYLVVKPGYHQRMGWLVVVGLPLCALCVFDGMALGLLAPLGAALLARGDIWRKIAAIFVILGLIRLAGYFGLYAELAFVYVHNLVAVLLWWWWRERAGWWHWLPLGMFALGTAAVMGGLMDGVWGGGPGGWGYYLPDLAPDIGAPWGVRLVLLFAFTQAVHYGIWLRLVPEDDRARETPRTFAASARALVQDLGPWLFGGSVLVAAVVMAWGAVALMEAREGYLRLALFHGYLELAVVVMFWVEGRPRAR